MSNDLVGIGIGAGIGNVFVMVLGTHVLDVIGVTGKVANIVENHKKKPVTSTMVVMSLAMIGAFIANMIGGVDIDPKTFFCLMFVLSLFNHLHKNQESYYGAAK